MADSAYFSKENERYVLEQIVADEYLMRKATRGNPMSEAEKATHHTIRRMRVRVEHVFGRMSQMGADLCRSIGLKRTFSHNHLSNLVYHMDRSPSLPTCPPASR